MHFLIDHPLVLFVVVLLVLWVAARCGVAIATRLEATERPDYSIVQGATLTLLGLVIGFTFSMAVNRYDKRKNMEEGEANVVSTEYLRCDLLPKADADEARGILRKYVDVRIRYYTTRDEDLRQQIDKESNAIEKDLWAVTRRVDPHEAPMLSLVVSGVGDILNARGNAQAAWTNRIPIAAWVFMFLIAIGTNVLLGYGSKKPKLEGRMFFVMPIVTATAFLLVADIESPRGGLIRVAPENLEALAQSFR